MKETLVEKQVLEDTSEQVEAMGKREESNNISKIGKRKTEKSKSLNETRPKETIKPANIVEKRIRCKRNFVQVLENSAANVENQTIVLLFVCHQKRHVDNAGSNLPTAGETSKGQPMDQRLMNLEVKKTETLIS